VSRNTVIEGIFLTADDAIQGLWGLHTFVNAAVDIAPRERVKNRLPSGAFQMTPEWVRFYEPDDLVKEMDLVFEFIHCRNSLVLLVSMFEGALRRFNEDLHRLSHAKDLEKYKKLLQWLFGLLRNTQSGSATMQRRLPETCGDIDNARRLRNCFAHNNGRYNQFYVDDALQDGWVQIRHHGQSQPSATSGGEKIFIANVQLERFLRSHIEVLHMAHNTIQRDFFGESEDYNYAAAGKAIEWHRILSGQTTLGM
jgi:hypothetical protein